ncbi:hypothetical protein [Azospirillum sp. B2RO_4]|uniref:hypothetical protein n=1 Tax=Azospirillum sp. B2RO_4 TaxID=3027796 RepID=UPI003DA90FA2
MPHDFGSSRDRRSSPLLGAGIGFHELRQACEISALREDLERLAHEAGALRDGVEQAVETVRDRFAALSAEEMADPMVLAPLLQLAITTLLDIREQARQLNTQTGPLSDDERPSWLGAADAPRLRQPAAAVWDDPAVHRPDGGGMGNDMGDDEEMEADLAPVPLDAPPPRPSSPPARTGQPALAAPRLPEPRPPAPAAEPFLTAPAGSRPPSRPYVPVAEGSKSEVPASEGHASWLAGEPAAPSPPSRAATVRAGGGGQRTTGGIDWLGPAGR